MKYFLKRFYIWRINSLLDDIVFIAALHGVTEKQLKNNVSYIRAKAKLDYYEAMLSVVNY